MIAYVYVLREKGSDEVRYVGRTTDLGRRLAQHLRDADPDSHSKKARWIATVLQAGKEIEMDVIETCELEVVGGRGKYWIGFHKDCSPLTNGGTGSSVPTGVPAKQASISRSKGMQPVIDEARAAFPHADSDSKALTYALIQWYEEQQEENESIDRVEMKLDKLIEVLEKLNNDATDRNTHP